MVQDIIIDVSLQGKECILLFPSKNKPLRDCSIDHMTIRLGTYINIYIMEKEIPDKVSVKRRKINMVRLDKPLVETQEEVRNIFYDSHPLTMGTKTRERICTSSIIRIEPNPRQNLQTLDFRPKDLFLAYTIKISFPFVLIRRSPRPICMSREHWTMSEF